MKLYGSRYRTKSGFSLVELAIVIAVMATLAAFGVASYGSIKEDRDAQMVMAAQSSLQSITTQGATRLDKRPSEFGRDEYQAVNLAAQAVLGQKLGGASEVTLSNNGSNRFTLRITSSDRTATFAVNANGVVELTSVDRFSGDRYILDAATKSLKKQ